MAKKKTVTVDKKAVQKEKKPVTTTKRPKYGRDVEYSIGQEQGKQSIKAKL